MFSLIYHKIDNWNLNEMCVPRTQEEKPFFARFQFDNWQYVAYMEVSLTSETNTKLTIINCLVLSFFLSNVLCWMCCIASFSDKFTLFRKKYGRQEWEIDRKWRNTHAIGQSFQANWMTTLWTEADIFWSAID